MKKLLQNPIIRSGSVDNREVLSQETGTKHFFFTLILPLGVALLCFLSVILISRLESLRILELRSYDLRMRAHGVDRRHYPNLNIVIIALDDKTDKSLKEPQMLWIVRYTRVMEALHRAGAKTIGYDAILIKTADDFIRYGIDEVILRTNGDKEKKKDVSLYIKDYSPHLGSSFGDGVRKTGSVIANMIEEESNLFVNSNKDITLFAGKENIGCATLNPDIDGIYRTAPAYLSDRNKESFFSFSFLLTARYLGKEDELRDGSFLKDVVLGRSKSMYINYVGDTGQGSAFRRFSFCDIDAKAQMNDLAYLEKNFKGKIALIGSTTLSSMDLKKTPFHYRRDLYPGVLIHAQAINTLLNGDFITRISAPARLIILFVLVISCFLIGFRLTPGRSILVVAAIAIAYWILATILFCRYNIWIDCAAPTLAIPIVLLASYGLRFITVDREKTFVRKALSRYVSQNVADEILKNPGMVKLGGEEREISVVFSDINNFTTISETHTPEEIMSALNEYFTLMEEVIFKWGGTLKQFVGDEIMVMFGAPARQEDHKRRAMLSAIEMISSLDRWCEEREKQGRFSFGIKMGVHCGRVVVGNVGSPHRTEYAAVGDTVNTAARIMGLNKALNTVILISEDIYDDVKDLISADDQGSHQVKGRDQMVHVYSVRGKKENTAGISSK